MMLTAPSSTMIFIDPPSPAYYQNRLFDITNTLLNRDDTLVPYVRVRNACSAEGKTVQTADYLMQKKEVAFDCDYYSMGVLENYKLLQGRPGVRLKAFVIFEPPVVDPRLYKALPALTEAFECVYVHNTVGDGYSLAGVDTSKLRKLHWPQPRAAVIQSYWARTNRQNRVVVINGNHIPRNIQNELYSKRIEAMAKLAPLGVVDLYGRGWSKWWSRASMWHPYWRHRKTLMAIYKGPCESKYEVLGKYKFSLCFENMAMKGYITEKIFDCFYAGTVPIYLGAQDIGNLIPTGAYIDCRKYSSWLEMWNAIAGLSKHEVEGMRKCGKEFVSGAQGRFYYDALIMIFNTSNPIA